MSADNYIAVGEHDGKWHVWMVLGGYSDNDWKPEKNMDGYWHREFKQELEAHRYAHQICQEELVEYGVVFVNDAFDGHDKSSYSK